MNLTIMILSWLPQRDEKRPESYQWWRVGDVVEVYPRQTQGCEHERFAFIHVVGLPSLDDEQTAIKKLNELLQQPVSIWDVDTSDVLRKRKWRIVMSRLTQKELSGINNKKEIEISWERLQDLLYTKTTVMPNDYKQDTDVVAIKASDL